MIFSLLFMLSSIAIAKISAVATTPDVAWLMAQVGGDKVSVRSLAKASQNYHFLEARPDFVFQVARADVVCQVGVDLEIGWLPKVLQKAANAKVMGSAPGFCSLGSAVEILQKPNGKVDRSMGDVHAGGNPHFWPSPDHMKMAAKKVAAVFKKIDSGNSAYFDRRLEELERELDTTKKLVATKLSKAKSMKAIEYHKEFFYLLHAFSIPSAGSIEEVPGVPPSAAALGRVALKAKAEGVAFAIASSSDPGNVLGKFKELSGVRLVIAERSLSDFEAFSSYREWLLSIANKISGEN